MSAFVFDDVKILDLTTEMGGYSTKLFADLGADVVKVESPAGDSTRQQAPYYGEPSSETSLYFFYLNTNKRSIVIDLETTEGQATLKELVRSFDIVVENFAPGYLASLGLDYDTLKAINPKLIMTSITPFGQYGPYKDFVANDLVGVAMGGLMNLGGYPDTTPLRPYGNQGYFAASLFAAVATSLALFYRDATQVGQWIDVSMQECVTMALENAIQFYDLENIIRMRTGAEDRQAGWGLYPCADGQVYIMTAGLSNAGGWENLVTWMLDEGVSDAAELKEPQWQDHEWRGTIEARERFLTIFTQFASGRTKLYLYEEGQHRKVPICPVNYITDVLENPQLQAREFFKELYHEPLGKTLVYTGPPYLMSASTWSLRTAAPQHGEHTDEVLQQYGIVGEGVKR